MTTGQKVCKLLIGYSAKGLIWAILEGGHEFLPRGVICFFIAIMAYIHGHMFKPQSMNKFDRPPSSATCMTFSDTNS